MCHGEKPINYMYWCACYKLIIIGHVPCLVNFKSLILSNYLSVITLISSKTREISLSFQSVVLLEHNLALGWYFFTSRLHFNFDLPVFVKISYLFISFNKLTTKYSNTSVYFSHKLLHRHIYITGS